MTATDARRSIQFSGVADSIGGLARLELRYVLSSSYGELILILQEWTGVPLYQLLRMCGEIDSKARFVHFEGADKVLKKRMDLGILTLVSFRKEPMAPASRCTEQWIHLTKSSLPIA